MPILQHYPWEIKTYSSGADSDTEKELASQQGRFLDSRNARLGPENGANQALEKIRGEVITYPKNFIQGDYFCIGAFNVNDDVVEFWADKNFVEDPLIRVNGDVVCKSANLRFRSDRPLQGDTNDSCVGGEVFVTDYEQAPYIFNIKDMVDSFKAGSIKYFSGFNPDLYSATLKTPLDIPVFRELVPIGGGGGLPVGTYAYSIRYVTTDGDRTNFSAETPTIAVPINYGPDSYDYPFIKTYGGAPNPSFGSQYGIKLHFRVTNLYNYNYIEVRRVAYNQGAGFSFIPTAKIVAKIPISPGQISIQEFIDPQDSLTTPLTVGDDEDLQVFSTIQTCKTLRYYNKRLVLMNLKYPSRDVKDVKFLEEFDGTSGFPIITSILDRGHADPWYYAYRKNLMSGERYNHGAVLYDGSGGSSFVVQMTPTQVQEFYTTPNHREKLGARSLNYCVGTGKGAPLLSDISNNLNYVYEIWYGANTFASKNDSSSVIGICNEGPNADPYSPFTPKNDADSDVSKHDYVVNTQVGKSLTDQYPYNPKGFKPEYFSRGVAYKGIDVKTLPSWAKAFSFVRTKSAKRVVCQGIGVYKMNPAKKASGGIGYTKGIIKALDEVIFFSEDIRSGYVDANLIADMQANPVNYKVQLVSPVGYFSEVYNVDIKNLARDHSIDMVTYARVQDENGNINPTETSGQVKYGKYLNPTPDNIPATNGPDFGDTKYGVLSFTPFTEGRETYYYLKLNGQIYNHASQGASKAEGWDIDEGKDFKEPFYLINIIRDGAIPPKGNTTDYISTGHYQKIESIIGRSDGNSKSYELVDERWEDCIPNKYDLANVANINTYVFVEDSFGVDHVWLNVTYKTPAQRTTIFNAIQFAGFYNDGTYNIEGCYTSSSDSMERVYSIDFSIIDGSYNISMFLPTVKDLIKVRYDSRFPIAVYPGEHFVGQAEFCPIDRYAPGKTVEPSEAPQFLFASGMPYHRVTINSNYKILLKSYGPGNNVQDIEHKARIDYLRQWMVMFPTEAKVCLPLMWGDKFPNVHYVMRPLKYKITNNMASDNNKMYPQYFSDYPGEENLWGYGGFHMTPSNNADYSTVLNDRDYISRPIVGFIEQTNYCSRIIWSLQRPIYAQDAPGLKTFPSLNVKDISDNQGCIKYAYDANSSKGSNLYAVCSRGICLLITEKSMLSDVNANQLAYIKSQNFISDEYWITKDTGMNDEMWRTAAEASVPYGKVKLDTLFFVNKETSYSFYDNHVVDSARNNDFNYHRIIYNNVSKVVKTDYDIHVCAGYDRKHEEYWVHIDTQRGSTVVITGYEKLFTSTVKEEGKLLLLNGMNLSFIDSSNTSLVLPSPIPLPTYEVSMCNNGTGFVIISLVSGSVIGTINPGACVKLKVVSGNYVMTILAPETSSEPVIRKTFVFNQARQTWSGYNDYSFDKFLAKYDVMYGHRSLETYTLNSGFKINGQSIVFEATQYHAPEPASDKEFIRIRINSSNKPTRVDFYLDVDGLPVSWLDSATSGPLYLKDYRGFEQYIPRKDVSVSANRQRVQGRLLLTKISHNLDEPFVLKNSGVQFKKIK